MAWRILPASALAASLFFGDLLGLLRVSIFVGTFVTVPLKQLALGAAGGALGLQALGSWLQALGSAGGALGLQALGSWLQALG
jgi:hypothetical protein